MFLYQVEEPVHPADQARYERYMRGARLRVVRLRLRRAKCITSGEYRHRAVKRARDNVRLVEKREARVLR